MTNIKKTKKGFTLMEVVTVVAIIAIVSTAGFVGVAVTLNNARSTQNQLAAENGYNFEAEARDAVRHVVPVGGHANVEYYTPDDAEPNTEPAGDSNPATPVDGTPAPGGDGDGGGGGVVIPADGGSANGGSASPADDPVEPAAEPAPEPEDPDPADPEDPDPVVPEDDTTTPANNGGSTTTIDGTNTTTNIPGISAPQNNYFSDWGCVETRVQVPASSDYSTVTIELQYSEPISRINTAWNGNYTVDYANNTITVTTTPGSDFGIQAISTGRVTVVSIMGS